MPAGLILRTASFTDAEAVDALLDASYTQLFPHAYPADLLALALPVMTRANRELLSSGLYHVVEVEFGQIVGCGGWSFADPATRAVETGIGHIRHFATHPDWLGRGIGRMIYDRCAAQAIERGLAHFTCWSSLNGQGFYAALGFVPVREVEALLGGRVPFPAVEMTRAITV
ncbi:GNAT family N-acetyltransferase [Methylobacterium hispanicum]|uniref:GNAT family N-acetyltransferase n=1 Tax=Methylobacterium hispanicum TaxID=270350 RepID=UPI002F3041D5